MVTILSPGLRLLTGIEQERWTSPLICTEQAPHCAAPQPYLVPVRPACSRSTHNSGVSSSTVMSRVLPLMLSFAMCNLLRLPVAGFDYFENVLDCALGASKLASPAGEA